MSIRTGVSVYLGPSSWFLEQIEDQDAERLLDVVYRRDEENRKLKIVTPGESDVTPENEDDLYGSLVAETGDFASLNEHVISNFAGLVRSLAPERLHLQNPPIRVLEQLERIAEVETFRFVYPVVDRGVLLRFRDEIPNRVIGQHRVRELLLAALYPLTANERTEPMVVMFCGPSGVGKTETARFLNDLLGGELFRKQFSMFHSDKFASYLFGAGHTEPSLAHDLLDRESGVILIDEFDKANPVFHSAFYEFFDGGSFEDKNYRVNVGRALIICTSNYASDDEVRAALGDALYSRFDAIIEFDELSSDDLIRVIDQLVDGRLAALSESEKDILSADELKALLYPLARYPGNVRKLSKRVQEMVSLKLVRALLH